MHAYANVKYKTGYVRFIKIALMQHNNDLY